MFAATAAGSCSGRRLDDTFGKIDEARQQPEAADQNNQHHKDQKQLHPPSTGIGRSQGATAAQKGMAPRISVGAR